VWAPGPRAASARARHVGGHAEPCLQTITPHPGERSNRNLLWRRACTLNPADLDYDSGGGTSYLTARGAAHATGLDDSAAAVALSRLEVAGLAVGLPGSGGWRLHEEGLTGRGTATNR